MSSELMMDSGISGKTKAMILGGVVAVFALTIGILTHSSKAADQTKPAAARSAQTEKALPSLPGATAAKPDAQAAGEQMLPQAADSAPDGVALRSETTTIAASPETDTAAQVAVDMATSPALASPSRNVQNTSSWDRASLDDSNIDSGKKDVAARVTASKLRSAVRPPPPPAIDALQPWWRNSASRDFHVQYVGQAASESALVFRFSKSVSGADAASQHIRIVDNKGMSVNGIWATGLNPYVLVYQGITPGRYMVHIDPALSSVGGAKLGTSLQGPVYVQ